MCHFYANPLSVFLSEDGQWEGILAQPEYLECFRSLASFRRHVEASVDAGRLAEARSLLEDDGSLSGTVARHIRGRKRWVTRLLRSLLLVMASGVVAQSFVELYGAALSDGID